MIHRWWTSGVPIIAFVKYFTEAEGITWWHHLLTRHHLLGRKNARKTEHQLLESLHSSWSLSFLGFTISRVVSFFLYHLSTPSTGSPYKRPCCLLAFHCLPLVLYPSSYEIAMPHYPRERRLFCARFRASIYHILVACRSIAAAMRQSRSDTLWSPVLSALVWCKLPVSAFSARSPSVSYTCVRLDLSYSKSTSALSSPNIVLTTW